jgi:hypothetical protein
MVVDPNQTRKQDLPNVLYPCHNVHEPKRSHISDPVCFPTVNARNKVYTKNSFPVRCHTFSP